MRQLIEKRWNRPILTFDDLWWPGFWPDLKNYQISFIMICDALSNAAYHVSLRDPGAELEGIINAPHQVVENLEAQQGAGYMFDDLSIRIPREQ